MLSDTASVKKKLQNCGWYAYDAFNRQIGMIGLDSETEYVYDALGRRMAKIVDGVATYYVYNAGYQVIEERDAGNQVLARYTCGSNNELQSIAIRGAGDVTYPLYTLGRPDSVVFPGRVRQA